VTLPIGADLGGYRVLRIIGTGGMGTVYLARHPWLQRSDAVKVLSAELCADPDFRARFLREADLAAGLEHPNIVRVYTRGETTDGRLWIAMQFVDGADADAAQQAGDITAARAVQITGEVAKALDYAHARGVIHRDIKPANFLLAPQTGAADRVLLADFGIARALDEAHRLTMTGAMVATVAYAAPEIIEGTHADHRADIYALGCSLYRMLTGRPPFEGSMTAVMMAHLSSPPPRVSAAHPGLPAPLDAVIARAMAKNPADRYPSARALADAATQALADPAAAATVTAPVFPVRPQPAPTPPPGWPGTPTAPPAPAAGPRYAPNPPPAPAPPPKPARARRRRGLLAGGAVAVVAALVATLLLTQRGGSLPAYQAQDFVHTFGTTRLDQRPETVAALSLADADTAAALGVTPVALAAPAGLIPGWLAPHLRGTPTVLSGVDATAVAAAQPAVIIDTSASARDYTTLSRVAPTITRPTEGTWNPTDRVTWIGRILGRPDDAAQVLDDAAVAQAKLRQQHPEFTGKTVALLTFSADGLTAALSTSAAAAYLSGLGFAYDQKLQAPTGGTADYTPLSEEATYLLRSDIAIVVRTDAGAGGGGFAGLPGALNAFPGTLVIVDDPDTAAALQSGGPNASDYLNGALVEDLTRQLH